MSDIKKLDNKEFVIATGGVSDKDKVGPPVRYVYYPGDRRSDPCKYCGAVDSLVCDRSGYGWEDGEEHFCNIFKCEKCGNESYFDTTDDHLLM